MILLSAFKRGLSPRNIYNFLIFIIYTNLTHMYTKTHHSLSPPLQAFPNSQADLVHALISKMLQKLFIRSLNGHFACLLAQESATLQRIYLNADPRQSPYNDHSLPPSSSVASLASLGEKPCIIHARRFEAPS